MSKRDNRRAHAAREQLRDRGYRTNPKNVLRNDQPRKTQRTGPRIEIADDASDPKHAGIDAADQGVTSVASPLLIALGLHDGMGHEQLIGQVDDVMTLAFGFITRNFEIAVEKGVGNIGALPAGLLVKVTVTEIK
jgi:hypothetical protein